MANIKLAHVDPTHPAPPEPLRAPDLWVLAKQIDEFGGEWTYPIFVQRAGNFHFAGRHPTFYEPVSSFENLGLEALLQGKAFSYCPPETRGDVGVSIKVYPSIFDAEDGVIPIPQESERPLGQHFIAVLGVKDADTLILRNSWSGWRSEAQGICYLTREYFEQYGEEGIVARPWAFGPDADTAEQLLQCSKQPEFVRLWRRRRRSGSVTPVDARPNIALHWYGCWSLDLQSPAEVLTVRRNDQVNVATAVVVHRVDNSTSDLSELFVWPYYRRQGYGLLIENFAATRARNAGSSNIGLYLWNSDAVRGRKRGISFMRAAKYTDIDQVSGRQFVAYGRRSLAESSSTVG
jgi:hypothetical protein